jgi:hypothetical protein
MSSNLTAFICTPVVSSGEITSDNGSELSICFSLQIVDELDHLLGDLSENVFVITNLLAKQCYASTSSSGLPAS